MQTHEFKPYLYLLPGKGYVAGNGCIDDDGNVIALHMLSHSEKFSKDIPGTQITYIRPTPQKMPNDVRIRIDRMKSSAVLQAIDANEAIKILQRRGRTISEIAEHPEKYGTTIIREADLKDFLPQEHDDAAKPLPKKPTRRTASRKK